MKLLANLILSYNRHIIYHIVKLISFSSKFITKHTVLCRGDFGRLGHGNSSDLFTPQPIRALHGLRIKQIACGDSHCLAVTMEGQVQRLVHLYGSISVSMCVSAHAPCFLVGVAYKYCL